MEEKRVAPLAFIQENLWAILAAAGAAYSGYLTGMTTMDARISALEAKTATMERQMVGRSDFMVCAVRNLDRIHDKLGLEPACPLSVPE